MHNPMQHWSGLGPIHVNVNQGSGWPPLQSSPGQALQMSKMRWEVRRMSLTRNPYLGRQYGTHKHTQIPSNPLNYDPDALRTFCGWHLCTAARISGVGIISCRHIASWWGTLRPESLMISHDIALWTLRWTYMTFPNVQTPDLHSVSTTAMKVGQVVVQPAAPKLVKVSLGVPHHPCISMLISY